MRELSFSSEGTWRSSVLNPDCPKHTTHFYGPFYKNLLSTMPMTISDWLKSRVLEIILSSIHLSDLDCFRCLTSYLHSLESPKANIWSSNLFLKYFCFALFFLKSFICTIFLFGGFFVLYAIWITLAV